MNILIAGSRGFIGSHCFEYFSANNEVFGCDISEKDTSHQNYFQIKTISDFNTILSENKFDLFINASGSAGVGFSIQYPEKDYELNVNNVKAMLEAIRLYQPSCKFINMSSAAVYGNPVSLPVSENALLNPLSIYGKHKLQAEQMLLDYHLKYGIKTCSLRIFSAYGPGLCKQIFWDIFLKAKDSKHICLFGTGNESRDFIFIEDLIKAIDIVATYGRFIGDSVNVASGKEITIQDAATIFLNKLGNDFQLQFSGEERQGDPKNWKADNSILRSLGFSPEFELEEGLGRLAEAYKMVNLGNEK